MNHPVGWGYEQYAVPLCLISLHLIAYLITHNRIQFFTSSTDVYSIANVQMPSVEFLCRPKIQNIGVSVESIVHLGPRDFLNRSRIASLSHIELQDNASSARPFLLRRCKQGGGKAAAVSCKHARMHTITGHGVHASNLRQRAIDQSKYILVHGTEIQTFRGQHQRKAPPHSTVSTPSR